MSLILGRLMALGSRMPLWAWLLVIVLLWGGCQRHDAKKEARARVETAEAAASAAEAARLKNANEAAEQSRAIARSIDNAQQEIARAAEDRRRADDAVARLRLAAAEAARSRGPAQGAGTAASSAASAPGAAVLSDVLGRCVAEYRDLATALDASRSAGAACERAYEVTR